MLGLFKISRRRLLALPILFSTLDSAVASSSENPWEGPWDFALRLEDMSVPNKNKPTKFEESQKVNIEMAKILAEQVAEYEKKYPSLPGQKGGWYARFLEQQDTPEALQELAENYKDSDAAYKLGMRYEKGIIQAPPLSKEFTQEDRELFKLTQALIYYKMGADLHNPNCMYALATLLLKESGEQHIQTAMGYLYQAHLSGHFGASYLLAVNSRDTGVRFQPYDFSSANYSFRNALEMFTHCVVRRNCAFSKIEIANMFRNGWGVIAAPKTACFWYIDALETPHFHRLELIDLNYIACFYMLMDRTMRERFKRVYAEKFAFNPKHQRYLALLELSEKIEAEDTVFKENYKDPRLPELSTEPEQKRAKAIGEQWVEGEYASGL